MVLCVLPLSEKLAGLEVNGEMDMVGLDRRELQCNILLSYYVICASMPYMVVYHIWRYVLVAINGSIPYMEVCGNMPNMVICLYVEVCLLW